MLIRTFNPLKGVASAQGLDVSNFQGRFDWPEAKRQVPGLAFGTYRITQGLGAPGMVSPDPDAAWNHQQIRDNGLRRGAYHFLDPRLSGKAQADYFVTQLGRLGIVDSDMLWLDNETQTVPVSQIADCAAAFMDELHKLRPDNPIGVYSNINFANIGADRGLGGYALWLAFPSSVAPPAPSPWSKWHFWQWGTRFAGGQNVDADAFNGTVTELDTWIASFKPSINPVAGLTVDRRFTRLNVSWKAAPGATGYTAKAVNSKGVVAAQVDTTETSCRLGHLKPLTTYTVTVRAHPGHSAGLDATVTVKTK